MPFYSTECDVGAVSGQAEINYANKEGKSPGLRYTQVAVWSSRLFSKVCQPNQVLNAVADDQ